LQSVTQSPPRVEGKPTRGSPQKSAARMGHPSS